MKKNLTFIAMVVDKSGSMSAIKQGAIDGFNNFVKAQREIKGKALATVCLFDNTYEYLADNEPLEDISLLSFANYSPNGSTALNDTLGNVINKVGQQMLAMKAKDRPAKVIVCVITDGEENSSKEFTAAQVKALIEQRKEQFGWEFVFIGANQDVFKTAKTYSFETKSTFSFAATTRGVQEGYDAMTSYVSCVRNEN